MLTYLGNDTSLKQKTYCHYREMRVLDWTLDLFDTCRLQHLWWLQFTLWRYHQFTTFADDTVVVATDSEPAIVSQKLQKEVLAIQNRFKKWRMKANESKSIWRLTWHKHIFAKWKQLGITLTKVYWLLGCKSKLSTSNKLLIYKTILKPIRTYGIQLWGKASTSNIEILERFQSKALCMIVDASWYWPNTVIRRDLQTPTFKEEIRRYSSQYSAHLSAHPNELTVNLMSYQTTGDCEDTCQMICLPDS
jgi:hypothetical protein